MRDRHIRMLFITAMLMLSVGHYPWAAAASRSSSVVAPSVYGAEGATDAAEAGPGRPTEGLNLSITDVAEGKQEAEARDGGYKNSMGIEAIAIFSVVAFLVRIAADIAQRVRSGRKKRALDETHSDLNRLAHEALNLISGGIDLYEDTA